MRVYISGPMSGYPNMNIPAFNRAAKRLRKKGYEVVSPPEIAPYQEGWEWYDYMKVDIKELMDCDVLAFLKNAHESKGARMEISLAKRLKIEVLDIRDL